jgi:hypothetical protein
MVIESGSGALLCVLCDLCGSIPDLLISLRRYQESSGKPLPR